MHMNSYPSGLPVSYVFNVNEKKCQTWLCCQAFLETLQSTTSGQLNIDFNVLYFYRLGGGWGGRWSQRERLRIWKSEYQPFLKRKCGRPTEAITMQLNHYQEGCCQPVFGYCPYPLTHTPRICNGFWLLLTNIEHYNKKQNAQYYLCTQGTLTTTKSVKIQGVHPMWCFFPILSKISINRD